MKEEVARGMALALRHIAQRLEARSWDITNFAFRTSFDQTGFEVRMVYLDFDQEINIIQEHFPELFLQTLVDQIPETLDRLYATLIAESETQEGLVRMKNAVPGE